MKTRMMAVVVGLAAILLATGAGMAQVTIETVPVGNQGNAADSTGYGAVDYAYNIGKYEVTAGQYTAFLNAVAVTDTYELYGTFMWAETHGCKIERTGSPGSYSYSVATDRANRPVNYVSWGDAARFANWRHNGQPTGAQDLTTTEDGAYYLNGAVTDSELAAVTREADWKWAITSENEWYKAAYHKNDGVTGNYWDYPTSTDSVPSKNLIAPDPGNNATFYSYSTGWTIGSPYYRTEVGEHEESDSPYGTFDQGGNVLEWTESIIYGTERVQRGGAYSFPVDYLPASNRDFSAGASFAYAEYGFRVSQVPEPASLAVLLLGSIGMLMKRRSLRR